MSKTSMPATYPPGEMHDRYDGPALQLVAVPGVAGLWDIQRAGQPAGTWQCTEDGARVTDLAGECVAVVSTFAGTQVAAVAGIGRDAGQWSDLAHKVLAGNCQIS